MITYSFKEKKARVEETNRKNYRGLEVSILNKHHQWNPFCCTTRSTLGAATVQLYWNKQTAP